MNDLIVIGGGLAGCETAWQAAERGLFLLICEMRPHKMTPAHCSDNLSEIICSNFFGSKLPDRSSGLLMAELELMNSLLLLCAFEHRVPAGHAIAIDRIKFSQAVQDRINTHPCIRVLREEVTEISKIYQ